MSASIARVRRFYDRSAKIEAARLAESPYRRLERDMTVRALAKHAAKGARILDVGGGPGAYLEPLASLGFDPWLCDLSSVNVRAARAEAQRLGLTRARERARRANAIDLSAYPAKSFDAALVAGPFYHLVEPNAQALALSEIVRVLRPGGTAVFAILPRLHPLRYLLREASRTSFRVLERIAWDDLLASGRYRNPLGDEAHPLFFTDAQLWDVKGFERFLEDGGLRVTDVLSAESFCAFLDSPLSSWITTEGQYRKLLDLVERTARDPDQIGSAEHVIVVARAPRSAERKSGHGRTPRKSPRPG